jgi:hypothetical protein
MKLVLVIYSGSDDRLVPELFDRHQAGCPLERVLGRIGWFGCGRTA